MDETRKARRPVAAWGILPACAALFVLGSKHFLPAIVASHFDAAGRANGFMGRDAYVSLMLILSVVVPVVIALIALRAFKQPATRIHLPHPEYWLAPQRREETLDYLSRQVVRFSSMLTLFLCYVQVLVIVANETSPPRLPMHGVAAGLTVYLGSVFVWLVMFGRHFRLPARADAPRGKQR